MEKIKQLLVFIIVVSIAAFFLAGCGMEEDSASNASTTGIMDDGLSLEKEAIPEKPIEISVGFWEIQSAFKEPEKDKVLQKIQSDFNIIIKPVQVTWTDYREKYLIFAASDRLPDVFANTIGLTQLYKDWINQGIIRALPDDLSKYPSVKRVMELPDIKGLVVNGKFYMIPRVSYFDRNMFAGACAMLVRKDWMISMGIEDPQNFEEFMSMLKDFVEKDPDGNNKDDTMGLVLNNLDALGKWVILTIHPQFNTYGWVKEGNKFIPSAASKDFMDVIIKLKRLYTEEVMDPEFAFQKAGTGMMKFTKGKAGAFEFGFSPSALNQVKVQWDKYNHDIEFTDAVKVLNIFPAEDGIRYHNTGGTFWSESFFSANVDEVKMDKILMLYDYLLSDEGQMLFMYGLEDIDYKRSGDKIIITREKNENGKTKSLTALYPSISTLSSLASWGGDREYIYNEANRINFDKDIMEMSLDALNWTFENCEPMPRPYEVENMMTPAKSRFAEVDVVNDVTRVILSEEDPVQMWEEILKEYESKGMKKAIEEVNKEAERLGIK